MKITPGHLQFAQTNVTHSAKESVKTQAPSPLRAAQSPPVDPALGQAQTQLKALPDIDMEKVAEIKNAISEGKIAINLDELTLSIQQFFNGNRP